MASAGFCFANYMKISLRKLRAKENVSTTLYSKYQDTLIQNRCFDQFRNIWEYVNTVRYKQKISLVTPVVVQPL